jgi:hypothetical protein
VNDQAGLVYSSHGDATTTWLPWFPIDTGFHAQSAITAVGRDPNRVDLFATGMGGVVRGQETGDLVAVASPMYVKFGLRNSRPLYPSGLHLVDEAAVIAREKVHRARVALEWMEDSGLDLRQSKPGAAGLGVPEP